jgi:hypothetical protein
LGVHRRLGPINVIASTISKPAIEEEIYLRTPEIECTKGRPAHEGFL